MIEKGIIHEVCGEVINEDQKKAIVDEWLRDMRSKGGKNRWNGATEEDKDKFSEALKKGWKKRRKAAKKKKA
jgi:general stress protein YciG